MKYQFIARCAEQTLLIEVNVAFKPGRMNQFARRVAAGQLLAKLEIESATIDASGEEMVTITTPQGTWVIAEGGGVSDHNRVI